MIDTANKRRAMLGLLGLGLIAPIADGAIDAQDRRHMAGQARFDAVASPASPASRTIVAEAEFRSIVVAAESRTLIG